MTEQPSAQQDGSAPQVPPSPPKKAPKRQLPYVRIRTYSELPCFFPAVILAFILWPFHAWGVSEEVLTHIWLPLLFLCIMGACVDLNWIVTTAIVVILVLIVPASQYVGIPFVSRLFSLIGREEGIVSFGAMMSLSKWIIVAFVVLWVAKRFTFYEVSPNMVERVVYGSKDWTERSFSIAPNYRNAFKLLFLGMGDLEISRDGHTIHVIDDVPFLAWGRAKRIDRFLKEVAVAPMAPPTE